MRTFSFSALELILACIHSHLNHLDARLLFSQQGVQITWSGFGFEERRNALALEGLAALWALEAGLAHGWRYRVPLQIFAIVGLTDLQELPAQKVAALLPSRHVFGACPTNGGATGAKQAMSDKALHI